MIKPNHHSNWIELDVGSIFDKDFEEFLDGLENNNQIELAMRDEWLVSEYQAEVYS
tara:strand:+ start:295 stop:462 length:168 start_codon:yes stop_codon:yes gene_type:complete